MVSSVKSLPNHYQTLGLSPTASEEDIARAFARAMSGFGARSLGAAAQIGAAFEVLRNPAKRREYDRTLGLAPQPRSYQWPINGTVRSNGGFMGSAWNDLAKQVASERLPDPRPKPDLQTRLERGAEPKIASFIASALRDPANPRVSELAAKKAPAAATRQAQSDAALERHLAQLLAVRNGEHEDACEEEVRTLDWKRPALALGGLVVAAGIIGTFAGLWVQGGSDEAPQAQAAATTALPKAQTGSVTTPLPAAATFEPTVPIQSQQQPTAHSKTAALQRHAIIPPQLTAPSEQLTGTEETPTAPPSEQVAAATDQPTAQSPAPAPVEAAMPLPKATIARTIEKIGYSCGTVASIAAVEGASPGVFKVSCSSGQDYQATPVNGRYHFRKMGGR
jgi:hypothetical protein